MEDIDELVRTRIIVLRAANKLSDDEDMSVVEEKSYAYYRRALESGEHIAYLVYDKDESSLMLMQYMYLEAEVSLIGTFVLAMVVKETIVGTTCIL